MAYRKKKVSHLRELYYIVFIIVFVTSGAFTIWGPGGYVAMKKKQAELETLRSQVNAREHQNEERSQTVRDLKTKKQKNEDQVRKGGFVRKGDIILQLPPEQEK